MIRRIMFLVAAAILAAFVLAAPPGNAAPDARRLPPMPKRTAVTTPPAYPVPIKVTPLPYPVE